MKRALFILVLGLLVAGCATGRANYSPNVIKNFPPEIQDNIKSGWVVLGMTQTQVRYSWGPPGAIKVAEPVDGEELREEWVYKSYMVFKTTLVFTGNILVEIMSSDPGGRNFKITQGQKP